MSFEAWAIFAVFWLIFVLTPGPNAMNCIQNGMDIGLRRGMVAVLAILCQATLFLLLSAAGITALIVASPMAFAIAKTAGAVFLIWLGIRGWINATRPAPTTKKAAGSIFAHAFAVAVINPKSVAGYLAAFSQFVDPTVPVWPQMLFIMPTTLIITASVYTGFTAFGSVLGKAAVRAIFNVWLRRAVAVGFVIYGVLLGTVQAPGRV